MSEGEIESVIEGCFHDSPSKLQYSGNGLVVPRNVQVVLWEDKHHPERYLLYGVAPDFAELEVVNNPFFEDRSDVDAKLGDVGGWPINGTYPNFGWIFESRRSITTNDGRIYVKSSYFEKGWRWYLEAVPKILEECREIFSGRKTENEFNMNPSRAF